MNVTLRRRIAVVSAAIGLLLSTGLTSAGATTSPYRGTLTFGMPTVHVNCGGNPAVPTSITFSATYDATHWSTSQQMEVSAYFDSGNAAPQTTVYAPPVPVALTAGQAGTLTATLSVPSNAIGLENDAISVHSTTGPEMMLGPSEQFAMSCTTPDPQTFAPPTLGTIAHPCLGTTTVHVTNNTTWAWSIRPVIEGPEITQPPIVTIPAGSSATVKVGSALRQAEHFWVNATAGTSDWSTSADVTLVVYSRACIPGHPATIFTATQRYSHDVLVTTIKPAIPGGAHVSFYRVSGSTRTLVATGTTGPRGISSASVNHRADACYLAVVHATHYSLRTTTATRCVD